MYIALNDMCCATHSMQQHLSVVRHLKKRTMLLKCIIRMQRSMILSSDQLCRKCKTISKLVVAKQWIMMHLRYTAQYTLVELGGGCNNEG